MDKIALKLCHWMWKYNGKTRCSRAKEMHMIILPNTDNPHKQVLLEQSVVRDRTLNLLQLLLLLAGIVCFQVSSYLWYIMYTRCVENMR